MLLIKDQLILQVVAVGTEHFPHLQARIVMIVTGADTCRLEEGFELFRPTILDRVLLLVVETYVLLCDSLCRDGMLPSVDSL